MKKSVDGIKKLNDKVFYGYKAKTIFERLCDTMEFNKELTGKFGQHQRLYAGNATKEGFGVWFIANSNWTKTKGGAWQNTIAGNLNWIEEKWDKHPSEIVNCFDSEKRVVFAKDPHHSDGYIFLGLYEPVSYNEKTHIRRYERVASEYEAA